MENMKEQHALWKSELKQSKSRMKTAPADALLVAACVCYHFPLDNSTRASLMDDWLNRCDNSNFDPMLKPGHHMKLLSLSAKMENFMSKPTFSITDSVPSLQQVDNCQSEIQSHRGDDVSSMQETERASSASSVPQATIYKHSPTVYDASVNYKTEIRVLGNAVQSSAPVDLESIDASSVSTRNLLAVRDNFTLQEVLSDFEELGSWKLQGLPSDVHSVHNVLLLRVAVVYWRHSWPVLIDPDNKAEVWIRALQGSSRKIQKQVVVEENLPAPAGTCMTLYGVLLECQWLQKFSFTIGVPCSF